MTSRELRIAGALMYACEGTKLRKDPRYENTYIYAVEFTNSDPALVSLFVKFLLLELGVDRKKIKAQLFIYPDLDQKAVMRKWSREIGIPLSQYQQVIVLKAKVSKFKPNPLGTMKVRFSSKEKFLQLQAIIDDVWKSTENLAAA